MTTCKEDRERHGGGGGGLVCRGYKAKTKPVGLSPLSLSPSLRVPSPQPSCWKAYPDRRDRELNAKVSARAQLGLEGRAKSLYTRAQGRQGRARPLLHFIL